MSKDELLRQTLTRAARGEPHAGDAFARFEAKRRALARFRTVVIGALAAIALGTLMRTLPGPVGEGPPADIVPGGTQRPVPNTIRRYADPEVGFALEFPGVWHGKGRNLGTERFAEFYPRLPADDEGTALFSTRTDERTGRETVRPNRFYVLVHAGRAGGPGLPRAFADDGLVFLRQAGAKVEERVIPTKTGNHPAVEIVSPQKPRAPGITRWCGGCHVLEVQIAWLQGWHLLVQIVAPDERTYQANAGFALKLIESIETQ